MVFVPSPSTAQIEVRGTLQGERVENVLYFLAKAPPVTPALLNGLTADIASWWATNALPWLPPTYTFREVYGVDLSTATSSTSTTSGGGLIGTRTAGAGTLPNNNTLCISFRTNQRGRSARGRNYWAGIQRNDVTGNDASAALQAGLIGVYNTLLSLVADDTIPWYWVVLSRYSNKLPRPQGLTNTITTVLIVDATIDSQRRRLPGRGA